MKLVRVKAFSLVEILVTSIVIAVGLLGIASIQSRTIKNVRENDNKATAVMLAQEFIQRTRANEDNFQLGRNSTYLIYDITGEAGDDIESLASELASNPGLAMNDCYTTTGCNSSSIAANDLIEWKRLVQKMLPNGAGKICMDYPVDMNSYNCNNKANQDSDLPQNVFLLKIKWTSILDNTEQIYAIEFNSKCTDGTGCSPVWDNMFS